MFYTLEHPCARMIKNHLLMKFLNYQYSFIYDESHDTVQHNNCDIHLVKELFFRLEKKVHDHELDRYEINDYEQIYRCNIKYSPTEIEKRWVHKKTK